MKTAMLTDLIEATRLTRTGRLADAAGLIQRTLQANAATGAPPNPSSANFEGLTIDGTAKRVEPEASPSGQGSHRQAGSIIASALDGVFARGNGELKVQRGAEADPASVRSPGVGAGAQFVASSFTNAAGSRPYKLYIPSGYRGQPIPLIVMLHGCTQSPDDFAAGTRMNEAAEEHTCFVVYPGQTTAANHSKCWNWFNLGDQQRGQGEPSLIAGITLEVMANYSVDPRRVYIAGLSAGGATAAIMGANYPDLYAAIGVHSGLACGAASDLPSAFAAMKRGTRKRGRRAPPGRGMGIPMIPAIVFHGDQDRTVHPSNGDEVIVHAGQAEALESRTERGQVPGGHAYSRTLYSDGKGRTISERWIIHGGGHAWSGGSAAGSYTDPHGPDAAREMLRFFLQQQR